MPAPAETGACDEVEFMFMLPVPEGMGMSMDMTVLDDEATVAMLVSIDVAMELDDAAADDDDDMGAMVSLAPVELSMRLEAAMEGGEDGEDDGGDEL